jgi:hypothetical protein
MKDSSKIASSMVRVVNDLQMAIFTTDTTNLENRMGKGIISGQMEMNIEEISKEGRGMDTEYGRTMRRMRYMKESSRVIKRMGWESLFGKTIFVMRANSNKTKGMD